MREICFLITKDDRVIAIFCGTESVIPDSSVRWDVIWNSRHDLSEIAHSHPGEFLRFSNEDLTTMEAVEHGVGKEFTWSVATRFGFLRRTGLAGTDRLVSAADAPWWLAALRDFSFDKPQ